MNSKVKIKSFTIIEVVVAMVITSVVIFAAITGFFKIQSLIKNTQISNTIIQEIGSLHSILMHDVELAISVSSRYDDLYLEMPGEKTIKYVIDDDKITRKWDDLEEIFEATVQSTEFKSLDRRKEFIYEIFINFSYESLSFPVYLYKEYPYNIKYQLFK